MREKGRGNSWRDDAMRKESDRTEEAESISKAFFLNFNLNVESTHINKTYLFCVLQTNISQYIVFEFF